MTRLPLLIAYNALWPAVAVALALAVAGCSGFTLAEHERDGYVRSFAEEGGVAPVQITWKFDAREHTWADVRTKTIHQPPRCRPDPIDSGNAPIDCQRAAVAHVEALYHSLRGENRCVVELRKHQQQGLTPDLQALGCDHTGKPL